MELVEVITPTPVPTEYVVKLSQDEVNVLNQILWGLHTYELPKAISNVTTPLRGVLDRIRTYSANDGSWDTRYRT